jgi:flavodoxin
MVARVIFDSTHGNTKTIAEAIAAGLGGGATAQLISGLTAGGLNADVLVVGSPIIGWRPSPGMQAFLAGLADGQLRGTRAAAFDTRVRLFIHGDAAGKVSRALERAGAQIVAEPRGFVVTGTEGPLADGEVDKAVAWGRTIASEVARAS